MSLTLESISPVPIADSNLPIALRPAVNFPLGRGSAFDDPGDEKSWHVSQRSENLKRYYEGRAPAWYASAVEPLAGADRVLDLGCGPGLALRALRDQGSSTVLGIDRWPAFVADSSLDVPIVAHDLTLPMPFLQSGSFDGVLSHYALDYVSPICVRQVLREAHRVLAPGGLLVVYLAAIGLAGGDESRTIAYSPRAMRMLLAEAGFEDIDVAASSNGRNTAAKARCSGNWRDSASARPVEPWTAITGDSQLSASFAGKGEPLTFEFADDGRKEIFSLELPRVRPGDDLSVSACARAQRSADGGTELQLWAWRGFEPLVTECVRVEFSATEMRIGSGGEKASHVSVWSPDWLPLEPPGNAHVRLSDLPAGGDMSEAERGAEGRQVVVESTEDSPTEVWDQLGDSACNRFLIRQASRLDLATLDREWLAARLHGVAVTASELRGEERRELLLWAGWRQSVLYLGGGDWESIHAVAKRRQAEMTGPVVLVDPALPAGDPAQPLSPDVAALAAENDRFYVLLHLETLERSAKTELARFSGRLLLGGTDGEQHPEVPGATENLRYLTERTLLIRLRQARGHSWAEVGRRPMWL